MASVKVMWDRGGAYSGQIAKTQFVSEQTMLEAGTWLAVQVERRTQDGKDEAGNRFKPYSDSYAKAKGVPRGRVDLTRSGDMFASWGVLWATRNRVRIGFASTAMGQRARYNEENGRPFLGIEKRWLADIRNRLVKGLSFYRL
jgi:hypothetical protein